MTAPLTRHSACHPGVAVRISRHVRRHLQLEPLEDRRLLAVDPIVADFVRDELLSGVQNMAVVGAPGQIAVFDPPDAGDGEGAFGIMHDGDFRPLAAAAF